MTSESRRGMTRIKGHHLLREGAPHDDNGEVLSNWSFAYPYPRKVAGEGRGLCACGAMSVALPTAAARRRWHQQHKRDVRNGKE